MNRRCRAVARRATRRAPAAAAALLFRATRRAAARLGPCGSPSAPSGPSPPAPASRGGAVRGWWCVRGAVRCACPGAVRPSLAPPLGGPSSAGRPCGRRAQSRAVPTRPLRPRSRSLRLPRPFAGPPRGAVPLFPAALSGGGGGACAGRSVGRGGAAAALRPPCPRLSPAPLGSRLGLLPVFPRFLCPLSASPPAPSRPPPPLGAGGATGLRPRCGGTGERVKLRPAFRYPHRLRLAPPCAARCAAPGPVDNTKNVNHIPQPQASAVIRPAAAIPIMPRLSRARQALSRP